MSITGEKIDSLLAIYHYLLSDIVSVGRLYLSGNKPAILIDSTIYDLTLANFQYVDYTSYQNKLMHKFNGVYRFLATDIDLLQAELALFMSEGIEVLDLKIYGADRSESHIDPTPPEFNFALSFEQVFGAKHIHALQPEAPYVDRQGHRRYIDYVLHRNSQPIAIELNGELYHHPLSKIVSQKKYRSQLFKQNSLVNDGYRVYRWSNRGMQDEFKFEDQIKEYFGESQYFQSAPLYRANRKIDFSLYDHQEKAVTSLQEKRANGEHTFLIVLPTGTGKTEVFIEDFRLEFSKGNTKRALAIVPSTELKKQLIKRMGSQLPDIRVGDDFYSLTLDVIVQTSAYVLRHFRKVSSEYFDYILVDEAHRAAAHGLRNVLEYFNPINLLGLTATDQRLDQQKLEDIFGSYKINLSLEEAIKQKLVPQIRVFRLLSNIDLSSVRFNGKEFVKSDLQKTVQVPSRDQLVVDLLLKYFTGCIRNTRSNNPLVNKQGVIFCVDIKHAKRMAELLNRHGINAAAVHGTDRAGLDKYKSGLIQFLCACDLLNEGWDAPQTSVIVMARPTMSKVLYTQQLGRGTRNHPDKEALYVIDVVDSYSAALQPWSVHNLFNFGMYQPFADLVNNVEGIHNQELIILDSLWEVERRLEPINIFNFEQEFGHLLNEEQLARELFVSTGTIKAWLKKGNISAHRTLPFGNKTLNYFSEQQVEKIKKDNQIKDRTDQTRKLDFYEFIEKRDYAFSYKIIFLLAMVNNCNELGEQSLDDLVGNYQKFYLKLTEKFGVAEKQKNPLNNTKNLDNVNYLKKSIRENPFEKFERKRFFYQCKDLNIISFDPVLWEKLEQTDLIKINKQMIDDGIKYFKKFNIELTQDDFNVLTGQKISNQLLELSSTAANDELEEIAKETESGFDLPFYPSLKIACGHFKTSQHDEIDSYFVTDSSHNFGQLNPEIHFVATASGNSMNGGKNAIEDGDLLLLEKITSSNAGSISGLTMAIEMQDTAGDNQYLLRVVKKQVNGQYSLVANNFDYPEMSANENMNTFARLKAILK